MREGWATMDKLCDNAWDSPVTFDDVDRACLALDAVEEAQMKIRRRR